MLAGSCALFDETGEVLLEEVLALFSEFMRQLRQKNVEMSVKASSDTGTDRMRCVIRKVEKESALSRTDCSSSVLLKAS